jgi:hypothetical protein
MGSLWLGGGILDIALTPTTVGRLEVDLAGTQRLIE